MLAETINVLLVDDHPLAIAGVRTVLQAFGIHVRAEAGNAADAMNALATGHIDVAILDIGLPSMNGLELARQLRAIDGTRTIRLIALTGYGQRTDVTASAAAGFDLHLVKPVTTDVLFAAPGELHRRARSRVAPLPRRRAREAPPRPPR